MMDKYQPETCKTKNLREKPIGVKEKVIVPENGNGRFSCLNTAAIPPVGVFLSEGVSEKGCRTVFFQAIL
jgi:hypothetical protein